MLHELYDQRETESRVNSMAPCCVSLQEGSRLDYKMKDHLNHGAHLQHNQRPTEAERI